MSGHWWTHGEGKSKLERVTLDELRALLEAAPPRRDIQEVILHHTWKPNVGDYIGRNTWSGVQKYHIHVRGWSDIGYHIGIDPEGGIWLLRPVTRGGAHTKHHNSNSVGLAMIGNYDRGKDDPLRITHTAALIAAILCARYSLVPDNVFFHRDFADKSCPGTAIDRGEFRMAVADAMVAEVMEEDSEEPGVDTTLPEAPSIPPPTEPDAPRPLLKNARWQFNVYAEGADLLARGRASQFNDHTTSSGYPADTPGFLGCSLPTGRHGHPPTAGSPFPVLPFGTIVRVYCPSTKRTIYTHLIDEGPAYRAEAGTGQPGSAMIDLTHAAADALGLARGQNADVAIRVMLGSETLWEQGGG